MEKTEHGWKIIDRDAGVLSYAYSFSSGRSNAFVARYGGDKLLVLSPPCGLTDGGYADLDAFGTVDAVVATNGFHHLGQAEWKARYPNATFYAPNDAMDRIAKKNPKAGSFRPLSELAAKLDGDVGVIEAPSTKCGETWAYAKTSTGYAWYASDTLVNMPELPKALPFKLAMKFTNSGPGYRVFNLVLKLMAKDKRALLGALRDAVQARPVSVMVPAHGKILDHPDLQTETVQLLA